jgi:hypothetical protein
MRRMRYMKTKHFLFLAGCERLLQFAPVISFSALELGELGDEGR